MGLLTVVSKKTLPLGCRSGLGYRERRGKLNVLRVRFKAGHSPAMVYVGMFWSLGSKHGQYTLGTLYSPLANSLSYGSAK